MLELYLEAGAALLMAQRPADCMALCEEVIGLTLELLPEKLVLEEEEEQGEAGAVNPKEEERMRMILWAGAAYLLQGHCHAHMRDSKQAVTHYTRCVGGNQCFYASYVIGNSGLCSAVQVHQPPGQGVL